MFNESIKYIAIVGSTASGKTRLAVDLARQTNGEIICADSRTVYLGMNIGTAKPTAAERAIVSHHMLDVADLGSPFNVVDFKWRADVGIQEIAGRGHLPLLVGGTGLYVYSVVYDYQFPAGPRTAARAEMEQTPLPELVDRLRREDSALAAEIDLQNPRRVIRALETVGLPRLKATVLPPNVLLLGLRLSDMELNKRIVRRAQHMFDAGLVEEVRLLVNKYGRDNEMLKSPGYDEVIKYLDGEVTLEQAVQLIVLHTRQLAKRQVTWFKRDPGIHWLDADNPATVLGEAKQLVRAFTDRILKA